MTLELLSIGEVMAEIRKAQDGSFAVGFAGDTYNTAVYCARALAASGTVGYMTCVGTDPLSNTISALAREEGLDCSYIRSDPLRNIGIYSVSTDDHGERSFHYWRSQSAARTLFTGAADFEAIAKPRILYLSGITLAIISPGARQTLIDHLRALPDGKRPLIAFDSNYRPGLWEDAATARDTISAMWEIADIALPSIDDEMALYGQTEDGVIARFGSRSWKACAIKRAGKGPLSPALTPEEAGAFSRVEKVIDTTAAGDSFNAGYLAAFIQGKDERECLHEGHALAMRVIQIPGAIAPLADW